MGDCIMKNSGYLNCLFEKPVNFAVGAFLFFVGIGFTVIGFTVLPVIGLLVAVPLFGLSIVFFAADRSKECSVNFSGQT